MDVNGITTNPRAPTAGGHPAKPESVTPPTGAAPGADTSRADAPANASGPGDSVTYEFPHRPAPATHSTPEPAARPAGTSTARAVASGLVNDDRDGIINDADYAFGNLLLLGMRQDQSQHLARLADAAVGKAEARQALEAYHSVTRLGAYPRADGVTGAMGDLLLGKPQEASGS